MGAKSLPANLLLIEKDAETRSGIERFFKMSGYRVTSVAGEKEALQLISEDGKQDLILFNTYCPPPESFALAYKLHQLPQFVQIPMVITSVHEHAFDALGDPGIDDFSVAYITEVSRLDELEHLMNCVQSFKK